MHINPLGLRKEICFYKRWTSLEPCRNCDELPVISRTARRTVWTELQLHRVMVTQMWHFLHIHTEMWLLWTEIVFSSNQKPCSSFDVFCHGTTQNIPCLHGAKSLKPNLSPRRRFIPTSVCGSLFIARFMKRHLARSGGLFLESTGAITVIPQWHHVINWTASS